MITMGTTFLKKLSVLLTVLLCSVLTFALPVVSHAAPTDKDTSLSANDVSDDIHFSFTAGEVTSGDPEAVLQLDKTSFGHIYLFLLQHIYPEQFNSPSIPAFYAFSARDCSLSSILTKGP